MSFRLFATAGVILAGAAALQTIQAGDALSALLASPAAAADGESAMPAAPVESGEPDETASDGAPAPAPQAAGPLPAPQQAAAPQPSFPERIGASADEYAILISLQERRRELERREADIDTRAQLVATAEAEVERRLAELHGVREEIRGLLGQLDEQEEARIASLVTTYEKMKAADAARILSGMDEDTALLVLSRLKAANLGNILGDMETAIAARFTQMLAARANTAEIAGEIAEAAAAGEAPGET